MTRHQGRGAPSPGVDRHEACDALAEEVDRVTALLRSVQNPAAPAIGDWSLAEVAMHLSQAWLAVPGLTREDVSEVTALLPDLQTPEGSLIGDIRDLGDLTRRAVRADPERDPRVLADRIEERARRFLARMRSSPDETEHPWLVAGVRAPDTTFVCHLLNETIVHGHDIARADGRRWPIGRRHAALVVDGFLVPVLDRLPATTMVDQEAAAGVRATFGVRVRGGREHLFEFEDGRLSIEEPGGGRRVDCRISADAVAFLMVAWGRQSQWPAILRGHLVAWGRRPWLGPRFQSLMSNV